MAREDVSFLADTADRVEMPLVVTGTCSGIATLMQKVTTLMLADADDSTRNYGGSLGKLLQGANTQNEATLKNYFKQAADDVYLVLQEEQNLNLHDLPDDEKITDLTVLNVTIPSQDAVTVEFSITSQAGETNYFKVDIPITTKGEQ